MKKINTFTWILVAGMLAAALSGFVLQASAAAPGAGNLRQDGALVVTQTAQASYTNAYQWSLAAAATPTTWTLFYEDEAVSRYTFTLTKSAKQDSGWFVSGEVHIENPTTVQATINSVTATVGSRKATVTCPVKLPAVLQPGGTLDCTYKAALQRAASGESRVRVRTSGPVGGSTASAAYTFDAPTNQKNDSIQVSANGQIYGPYSHSTSFSFEKVYSCADSAAPQVEEATIVETGQTAQASVTIDCPIGPGVGYERSDQARPDAEGGWILTGTFDLHQETGMDMYLANVREILTFAGDESDASVDCGYDFSSGAYKLVSGAVLHCTFQQSLPDNSERWLYTRMTFEKSRFLPDGTRTAVGTFDFVDHPTPVLFNP